MTNEPVVFKGITMVIYQQMCTAIDGCSSVTEAKDIHDKAYAFEQYSKQIRDKEGERLVREIRLRAERKLGELISKLPKASPVRHFGNLTASEAVRLSKQDIVKEFNIPERTGRKYEQIARIPKAEFEDEVKKPKASTSGLADYAKKTQPKKEKHIDPPKEQFDDLSAVIRDLRNSLKKAVTFLQLKNQILEQLTDSGEDMKFYITSTIRYDLEKIKEYLQQLDGLLKNSRRKKQPVERALLMN